MVDAKKDELRAVLLQAFIVDVLHELPGMVDGQPSWRGLRKLFWENEGIGFMAGCTSIWAVFRRWLGQIIKVMSTVESDS